MSALLEHPLGAAATLGMGIALLLAGGHWLVSGSVTIARRLGVSTLIIGLTVVAFGTSAPEFAFNVIASAGGHGELSFGNIVGSNIANIGLVLGITALVHPLKVHGTVVTKELPWLLAVSAFACLFAFRLPVLGTDAAGFGRIGGGVMLVWFVVFFIGWFRMGRREAADPLVTELGEEAQHDMRRSLGVAIVLVLVGLAALIGGGKLTEIGAVDLARRLGLSEALIGLTIVAIATSLPELVTAIIACRKGHDDLAVGNVVGSNVFNLLLVLGVTAVVAPVALPDHGWVDLIAMFGLTCVFALMALTHRKISRYEGALLLVLYFGYMAWRAKASGLL